MKRVLCIIPAVVILAGALFLIVCGETEIDETSEIVQPANWYEILPRPVYATLERVESSQWWFEVYKLPADIYVIYEPYQFEEAISYLVIGKDRAGLIDTGTGIGDLKKLVGELTDLPVTVINTHAHYDHVGNNYQFDDIAVYNEETEINRLLRGIGNADLQRHIRPASLRKGLPEEFDPAAWTIPPVEPTYLMEEGTIIDLGGRTLEVIFTPGHSPGEICLLDKDNRILFTGDMFFPGPLYAFGDDVDIDVYVDSFKKINARLGEYDYLCAGHNDPWVKSEVIPRVIEAFSAIRAGEGEFNEKDGIRRYFFDGFDILIRSDMVGN